MHIPGLLFILNFVYLIPLLFPKNPLKTYSKDVSTSRDSLEGVHVMGLLACFSLWGLLDTQGLHADGTDLFWATGNPQSLETPQPLNPLCGCAHCPLFFTHEKFGENSMSGFLQNFHIKILFPIRIPTRGFKRPLDFIMKVIQSLKYLELHDSPY